MSNRAHISLTTKLASALLALGHVPYEQAKKMTAKSIIALYQFDHGILHAIDPIDEPWNLTPRLKEAHREKSRADTSKVAKVKRLSAAQEELRRALLRPCGQKRTPHSQIRSRGFDKSRTRKFDGTIVPRAAET